MKSSFYTSDVTLLLKDITGCVQPLSTIEREQRIQSGIHYSAMLPLESPPSPAYKKTYENALVNCTLTASYAISQVAERIYCQKSHTLTLVSLARAGIPIGILIKHYLEKKYSISVPHYAISIIRGIGVDQNALKYILKHHSPETIQFVDGWVGKGTIQAQLQDSLLHFPNISPTIAVPTDPANITELCGTHEDLLIPSACLNATVSGLISRTFLREDLIGPEEFHGAVYYPELAPYDCTYEFIQQIESHFDYNLTIQPQTKGQPGINQVKQIASYYHIKNLNFIKPGIGETTRVLLRRIPWKLLIHPDWKDKPELNHLLQLAAEKKVPIEYVPLQNYKTCGIIQNLSDA